MPVVESTYQDIKSIQRELIDELIHIVNQSENVYLKIAKLYPDLLGEIEKGLKQAQMTVDSFQMEGCKDTRSADTSQSRLCQVMHHTRDIIEEGIGSFSNTHGKDNTLFASLTSQIADLSKIAGFIQNIRDDSEEMELISLNAMTVALKAGAAGKAFSYITEELKRLSARTITLTDNLTESGSRLRSTFADFQGEMKTLIEFQTTLVNSFNTRITESFDFFRNGIQKLIDSLQGLTDESKGITLPIITIMQEIQLQDIIRQSMDHVIISLREVEESSAGISELDEDRILDELAFLAQAPELCSVILKEVAEKLSGSIRVFTVQSEKLEDLVQTVDQKREQSVRELVGTPGKTSETSVTSIFNASMSTLRKVLDDLATSMTMKNHLKMSAKKLLKEVKILEEYFRSFNVLISRFHNIDIASRIEVAKQSVLRDMKDTVLEMSTLTGKIDSDVLVAVDTTTQFLKEIESTVQTYTEALMEEESFITNFSHVLEESYQQLNREQNDVINSLKAFSLYSGTFISMVGSAKAQIDSLQTLENTIESRGREISGLGEQAKHLWNTRNTRSGTKSWSFTDTRLKAIIEKFTIFAHKKTAADIAGFTVEDGTDSGEVTFF